MVSSLTSKQDVELFDKVPGPLFRIRLENNKFIFSDSNSQGFLLTEGKVTSLIGRDIEEIWQAPENQHLVNDIKKAFADKHLVENSFWHTFVADGVRRFIKIAYVPFDASEVLLFVEDLTEIREQISKAANEHAKYDAIFDRSAIGLLLAKPDNFLDCNSALCEMLGYEKSEIIGKPIEFLVHAEDLPEAIAALEELDTSPCEVVSFAARVMCKDGGLIWCFCSVTGVVNDKGELSHHLATVQDISELRRGEEKTRNALVATVRAIAATVDARDPYTAGHMSRVADIALKIAKRLNMDPQAQQGLSLGCMIHDIGKIGLPSEILNKPGRLSRVEFELLKGHCQIGCNIVKDVEFPWPIKEMIVQHHERVDGSGYPHGLKGEEIIQEARILAVADVFEALTSHRPYRPAYNKQKALKIFKSERGRLDPEIVDCCLDLVYSGKVRRPEFWQ